MLKLNIPAQDDIFDEINEEFISFPTQHLSLEHSLISIAKWEAKWHIPFLTSQKTRMQNLDYISCMVVSPNFDPRIIQFLTASDIDKINEYIANPMTATVFSKRQKKKQKVTRAPEIPTSETIYYWMIAFNIPREFEKWHLNRLLTLIKMCDIKSQPPEKMSRAEILKQNAELNEQRRRQFNTHG